MSFHSQIQSRPTPNIYERSRRPFRKVRERFPVSYALSSFTRALPLGRALAENQSGDFALTDFAYFAPLGRSVSEYHDLNFALSAFLYFAPLPAAVAESHLAGFALSSFVYFAAELRAVGEAADESLALADFEQFPTLDSPAAGELDWIWGEADPYYWFIYVSTDGGMSYNFLTFAPGADRSKAGLGNSGNLAEVRGVDIGYVPLTPFSNAVLIA